jgi:hypothetical protein
VWEAAQTHGRFLITQDLDFSDARKYYTRRGITGVLLLRLPQSGRDALFNRIATLFRAEAVDTWSRCIVTATPRKVRVRRST